SRGHADLRPYLRRWRLGGDDPGASRCALGVAGFERKRAGRRRRRAGGPGPRRRPALVRLRFGVDRLGRPGARGGPGSGRAPQDPWREHGAAPGAPAIMIIDVNAYLGHFAFRRLRHNTADSLLKLMDARKIDRAVVSSASAITYRNVQSGNEEIDGEVKAHRDRLIPFAVINPTYAGWEDDLKTCHEGFGMRGLRLYPGWHNYRLSDSRCLDLVRAVAARGLVVSIPIRVEDHRQRSWLVVVPDVSLDDVAALVRACPEARF